MDELIKAAGGSPAIAFAFGLAVAGGLLGIAVAMIGRSAINHWAREFGGWKSAINEGAQKLGPVADVGERLSRVEADVHAMRALLESVPKAITASEQAIEVAVQHGDEMNEVRERLGRMEADLRTIRDELIKAALGKDKS